MKLNWGVWLYGLVAALVGGGASAISAGVAQSITDPTHADVHHLFYLMGITFIVAGAIAAFAYLAKSPLPAPAPVREVWTDEQRAANKQP